MTDVNQLITKHLDIWTAATEKKSSAGRWNSGAISLYGIKKLRELILELAIRGKLSEQNTAEGTAADSEYDDADNEQKFLHGCFEKEERSATEIIANVAGFGRPFFRNDAVPLWKLCFA